MVNQEILDNAPDGANEYLNHKGVISYYKREGVHLYFWNVTYWAKTYRYTLNLKPLC